MRLRHPFYVAIIFTIATSLIAQAQEKLNVIILYVDDMGWEGVACYGNKLIDTPHIDQMSKDGVRFTNAYSAGPNCSPSRASLLTGLYTPQHGITNVISGKKRKNKQNPKIPMSLPELPISLDTKFTTIAEVFKEGGYATASIGKWHLGRNGPEEHGFDISIGGSNKGHHNKIYPPYGVHENMKPLNDSEHITDCLGRYVLDYVEKTKDNPFFLYVPFFAVHSPFGGNKELTQKYNKKLPASIRKEAKLSTAMTEGVDVVIGKLRKKLKALDIDKKTLLVFCSDNGGAVKDFCGPLRGRKGQVTEGGIRVPFIICGPGVNSGLVCDTPVIQVDLMPTLLSMAGLKAPPSDGINITPLLKGETIAERNLFWHYPHYSNSGSKPASVIRSGDYKLIHWYETGTNTLYNLKEDLAEETDLTKQHPEKAKALKTKLDNWLKEINAKIPQRL